MFDDAIAAIVTPIGEGGLAVIRISGPKALEIADACFRPGGKNSPKPSAADSHTIHYGHIASIGRTIDEVLLSVLRAPRTFTCEDTVEISCHGGLLVAKSVLDAVLAAGARMAEPGEFTRRAFLNGRIDLTQAEAVADLIHSRTELALSAANEQLAGKLSQRIVALREVLLRVLAHVEAHIDFPDEDIAPDTRDQFLGNLKGGVADMDALLATANEGRILRRGIRAAIVGRPNVGKSSLLNELLGHDRAIVSETAGTTRDTIEETANIRGIPVVFVDTAGLRDAGDAIEAEGIRRSRGAMEQADLILHVLDGSAELTEADRGFLTEFADRKRILIANKSDLEQRLTLPDSTPDTLVLANCRKSGGVDALRDRIRETVWTGEVQADMLEVMINSRHQDALHRAKAAALRAVDALEQDLPLELTALDLRTCVASVGEIVGKTTTEDLLDSIFSQFCLGK